MTNASSKNIWEWALVKLIVLGTLLLFVFFTAMNGYTEESVRFAIRWSARISVTCFSIAFAGKYFHQRVQSSFSFWIFMNRKYWGISFALVHLIHLSFLGLLQYSFHPVFEKAASISLFSGGLAYVFLILMLLTSFDTFAKLISKKQWTLLHTLGSYWIWFIYMSSYTKRVLKGEYWNLILLSLLISVLLFRLSGYWTKKAVTK